MATINATELQQFLRSDRKPTKVGFFAVFVRSFVKDLQIKMRYKQNFVGQFIRTLVFILVFWMFAMSFAFNDLPNQSTNTVFLFFISGLILMMYDGVALWAPYQTVRRDLYNGTLESVYQSPASRYAYFLGGNAAQAIFNSVFIIPLLITIFVVVQPDMTVGLVILSAVGIAITTMMAMGIIIGLTAILWKNMGALINILGMLFQFVTGTILPFASLPYWAQIIGYVFPVTWALDLIRFYVFYGFWTPIFPVFTMWVILLGQLLIFVVASKFLLGKVETYSKKNGLHLL